MGAASLHCSTIAKCQSAATSKVVKRYCAPVSGAISSTMPLPFAFVTAASGLLHRWPFDSSQTVIERPSNWSLIVDLWPRHEHGTTARRIGDRRCSNQAHAFHQTLLLARVLFASVIRLRWLRLPTQNERYLHSGQTWDTDKERGRTAELGIISIQAAVSGNAGGILA